MESGSTTDPVANPAQGDAVRASGQPRGRTRVNDTLLREQIDHAMQTATTLLAENYLAQDRHRLIHCIETLNQATKSIEGGVWTADLAPDPAECAATAPKAVAPLTGSSLIARDPTPTPLRSVA